MTAYTPYTMAAVFLMALLYLMVQKTNRKNYRLGKEHGSARWAEAAELTKQLGDKANYHRILSQNLRLSMNTRKTMRNNNIFCIGGSGAGKSMFLIKCNIMEMQGSFAATDPKGWIALYDRYADGNLERELFLNEKKKYDADMERMEEELAALRHTQEEEEDLQHGSRRKADQAMAFLEESELTEDMKEKLIEKVIVYPESRIEIVWGFKENLKN